MSDTFPQLKSDLKTEGRRKPRGKALFARECREALCNLSGSIDLSRAFLVTIGGLRFGSSRGLARLVDEGSSLSLELGARFGLLEQFRVLGLLAAGMERFAHSQPELQTCSIVLAAAVA